MIKDITLGQFFPGNSILHRADPGAKILLTILYIVDVFLADSLLSYLILLLFSAALVLTARISFKTVLKSMKPLVIVIAFTSILNIFWTQGEDLLFSAGPVTVYAEGVIFALKMVVRITTLLVGTSVLLTYTTSPIMLTDGLERILNPLKLIHVPVHEFSLMMTIALRFIPTLIEETDKIMSAQKARGADFSSGSLVNRAKALVPVLIPLFISSFRRADELATAMECRCYHGDDGRTKMNQSKPTRIDLFLFLIICAVGAAIIAVNRLEIL